MRSLAPCLVLLGALCPSLALAQQAPCALLAPVARVALDARGALAVSLRMVPTAQGARAWVSLARPARSAREGLAFPAARVVALSATDDAVTARMLAAPGTESDPELAALGEQTLVLAPARAPTVNTPAPLTALLVDAQGRAVGEPRVLPGTEGMSVDSPLVATATGAAVLLGRRIASVNAAESALRVREELWRFDAHGAPEGEPALLTEAQADDALGRHRAGLAWVSAQGELVATWSQRSGAESSVWSRRYGAGAWRGEPLRVVSERERERALWGSAARGDGTGVLYRSGGERGSPVRWHLAGWGRGQSAVLGEGYDPLATLVDGRVFLLGSIEQGAPSSLLAVASLEDDSRVALGAEPEALASLQGALDVELVSVPRGAVLAWLEAGTEAPALERSLRVAWVRCAAR